MPDLVACRSDGVYAERPLALHWQGARLEVIDVLARWRTPQARWFRVRAGGPGLPYGQVFDLRYDEAADVWQILPR
jgi:hypothetical protein